jgi:hypothetical protein
MRAQPGHQAMLVIDFERDVTCLMVVAFGLTLLGVLQLVFRSRKGLLIPAVVLAVGCGGAVLFRSPREFWLPQAILSGAALFLVALRCKPVQALLRSSGLHALLLLLIGPGLLVATAWLWYGPPELVVEIPPTGVVQDSMLRPADERLVTDRGHPVPLFTLAKEGPDGGEREWMKHSAASLSVLRTGPADQNYNCHGWVFAGGRGWLYPSEVDDILRDNGYERVSTPRPGDLILYRGVTGEAAHTGLVRVAEGRLILIESKWAWLGRYVHAPYDSPYGSDICYYRSARAGHQLAGANSGPAPDRSSVSRGNLGE